MSEPTFPDEVEIHYPDLVDLALLTPHPANYKNHPDDQIDHLIASIESRGIYKPIVTAEDYTILIGHGITQACRRLGLAQVPVIRTQLAANSVEALALMVADNETTNLAERDDRKLSELLKGIPILKGTGFDEAMLANLLFVTRPKSEIKDFNAAAHWVGMPEYQPSEKPWQIIIAFLTEEDRDKFNELHPLEFNQKYEKCWTAQWPPRPEGMRNAGQPYDHEE